VDIAVSSFDIDIKDPVAAGDHIFNVEFKNSHNVHLAKVESDEDLENLKEWMNGVKVPSPVTFLGGAEQGVEGTSSTFKATLEPGRYAFVTYGLAIHGMVKEIHIPEFGAVPASTSGKSNKPAIQIEFDVDGMTLPENIDTGKTPIVIKNTGSEDYAFNFIKIKEGETVAAFKKYFEGVYVTQTVQSDESKAPYYRIFARMIPAGEQITVTLNMEQSEYVMFPLALTGSMEAAWRDGNIVHSLQADSR
jgi:hypothetical protein